MDALIIIDAQNGMPGIKRVVNSILKQIKKAIDNDLYIFIVEYQGEGKTIKQINNKIKNYKKCFTVLKNREDGSLALMKKFNTMRKKPKNLFVTGVVADCCVMETVKGLHRKYKDIKINIVKNAITNWHRNEKPIKLNYFVGTHNKRVRYI